MKKVYLSLFILMSTSTIFAQTLNWAKNTQGGGNAYGRSVAVDASDNVYIVGNFNGTEDFNPGSATVSLTSNGGHDIFIQKLDANGNYVWAQTLGSVGEDIAFDVAVSPSGDVYVTGWFSDTVDFDFNAGVAAKVSNGGLDIFVLKLDSNGNFVHAETFGSASEEKGLTIAANDSFYVIGCSVGASSDFDPSTSTSSVSGAVLAKYNHDGTFGFAFQLGAEINGVEIDAQGNIYSTGYFAGGVNDFDPGAGTAFLTSNGTNDVFISKLTAMGNYVWAKNFGGSNAEVGFGLDIDNSGNVYNTGYFNGTVDFDLSSGAGTVVGTGLNDIYLIKVDSNGNFVWVGYMVSSGDKRGLSIDVDNQGNVFTTGYFRNNLTITPMTGSNFIISNAGDIDGFVSIFGQDGSLIWANSIGSSVADVLYSGVRNSQGDYIFAGYHVGDVDVNPSTNTTLLQTSFPSSESMVINWNLNALLPVAIDRQESNKNIAIFPNPSHGALTIQLDQMLNTEAHIQVINNLGQLLSEVQSNSQYTQIVLPEIAGLYLIRIQIGDDIYTQKVIRE